MTKAFFAGAGALVSPRTVKYVEAMVRQGDNFDYDSWLKKVREEEAQAKQLQAAEPIMQITGQIDKSNVVKPPASALMKGVAVPRAIWRSNREAGGNGTARWLKKVSDAWDEFQADRARDAVYAYLEAVFAIVMHFRARRRTERLLRHAFELADLSFDKKADPFTAVIRCTSGGAADNKMISKWARALRYAAGCKEPEMQLKAFLKRAGGVNECAAGHADKRRRRRRPHC